MDEKELQLFYCLAAICVALAVTMALISYNSTIAYQDCVITNELVVAKLRYYAPELWSRNISFLPMVEMINDSMVNDSERYVTVR